MRKPYYFTISSLPYLLFYKDLPISKNDFFAISAIELDPKDLLILRSVRLFNTMPEIVPLYVLRKWYKWEMGLRNAFVKQRSARLGLNKKEYLKGDDYSISSVHFQIVEEAFKTDSPFEAEEMIDKARWRFLDELEFDYCFGLEKLVIYYLRLQILDRRSSFNAEKGIERLDAVLSQVEGVWGH